jgi:hypothetical protein
MSLSEKRKFDATLSALESFFGETQGSLAGSATLG